MRQNQSIIKYDACDHPFADAAEAIGRKNKPEPSIGYFIGWRRSQTGKTQMSLQFAINQRPTFHRV
jgi:hypothetical protein